jgi:hypothetical protein
MMPSGLPVFQQEHLAAVDRERGHLDRRVIRLRLRPRGLTERHRRLAPACRYGRLHELFSFAISYWVLV